MLQGKTAIITGAGRGIGAATAKLLATQGAKVILIARTEKQVDEVVSQIEQSHGKGIAHGMPGDVSDERFVRKVMAFARDKLGGVDILVNNAAIARTSPIEKMTLEDFDETMNVNVRGVFVFSKLAIEQMRALKKKGSIINLSSLGGVKGTEKFPTTSAYVASKAAVLGLTEALAVETKAEGIRINCIAPGAVDTQMLREAAPHLKTETTPDDIARLILFLSDATASGSLSGTTIEVHSNA